MVTRSEGTRDENDAPLNSHLTNFGDLVSSESISAPLNCCNPEFSDTCFHNQYQAAAASAEGPRPDPNLDTTTEKGRYVGYYDVNRFVRKRHTALRKQQQTWEVETEKNLQKPPMLHSMIRMAGWTLTYGSIYAITVIACNAFFQKLSTYT